MTYLGSHPSVETLSTSSSTPRLPVSLLPFTLSGSQTVHLLAIDDPSERSFYTIEATRAGWSSLELRRQLAGVNVHREEDSLVLPSKAELRRKRLEWTGEADAAVDSLTHPQDL